MDIISAETMLKYALSSFLGPPEVDNSNLRLKKVVTCKSGHNLRIHIPYIGSTAEAEWTKDGCSLADNKRCEIETTDTYSHIIISNADRYNKFLFIPDVEGFYFQLVVILLLR